MGVMAAVALTSLNGPTTANPTGDAPAQNGTTPTSAGPAANAADEEALRAICVADYGTLTTALQFYQTLHGVLPAAGTSWAAGVQSGSSLLQSWPSSPGHFSFTWNGATVGVVPAHGKASEGSEGTGSSATGCYARL